MKITAVFKTHVDIGFTDLPMNILHRYATGLLKDAVETCEKTASAAEGERFVWTLPSYPLFRALEETDEDLKSRAEKLIEAGQLVWHALPFTLRTDFFTQRELRFGMEYSRRLCERYGKKSPVSAKMTDLPGHCSALIDVLSENGVKFLHLGSNPASTHPDVPPLFFWESVSKNRILVYYNADYGSTLKVPDGWKFDSHLALIQSGGNQGVHSPEIFDDLRSEAKVLHKDFCLRIGTLDDFYEDLIQNDLSDVPVIRGELGNTWIQQLGSFPRSCKAIKESRRAYEPAITLLEAKNDRSFDREIDRMMENILLFGEHSGGVDTKRFLPDRDRYDPRGLTELLSSPPFLRAVEGWNQEYGFALAALKQAKELNARVFAKYGVAPGEPPVSVPIDGAFRDDRIEFTVGGREIVCGYRYRIIGKDEINAFLNDYLTCRENWALEDFGKKNYPNIPGAEWGMTSAGGGVYRSPEASYENFGNSEEIVFRAERMKNGAVIVSICLKNKRPTLFAESGYFFVNLGAVADEIAIERCGIEVDPRKDVIKGANFGLHAVGEFVRCDDVVIRPLTSCLVSFGEDKIFRCECESFKEPENGKIVFNLFNNMFGTGSPQWLDGELEYCFVIEAAEKNDT